MVRKTREQVWRELDDLGEDEVRARLEGSSDNPADTRLVREWLERKERVASELSATAAGVQSGPSRGNLRLVGGVALIALSAAALGYVMARRRGRGATPTTPPSARLGSAPSSPRTTPASPPVNGTAPPFSPT